MECQKNFGKMKGVTLGATTLEKLLVCLYVHGFKCKWSYFSLIFFIQKAMGSRQQTPGLCYCSTREREEWL
jgi:hypothetical protein